MPAQRTDEGTTTTETTRRFEGYGATFGTDPEEIYIELRAGRPSYIRLREGHYLQEGDAFHREQLGMDSPTLDTWEVVEITPERVVGRDVDTGEGVEWPREAVEKGLAIGTYSTNLTDFERISVYQVGSWADYDADADAGEAGHRYTGRPYVAVVAYGDNGLKFGRRYRFAEPGSDELVLWTGDEPAGGFSEAVAQRLKRRVREALEDDGFVVSDGDEATADRVPE